MIIKRTLLLLCLSVAIMAGCSETRTANLQDQCSAGSKTACEELAHAQTSTYQQQTESGLQQSRPMIPTPATAVPPANHLF
jgi:hypothetical protein